MAWVREGVGDLYDDIELEIASYLATLHLVGSHLVTLDGDTATAQCEAQAQHVRRGVDGGSTFTLGGRYRDQVTRTPAGWRITHRDLETSWVTGNPAVLG